MTGKSSSIEGLQVVIVEEEKGKFRRVFPVQVLVEPSESARFTGKRYLSQRYFTLLNGTPTTFDELQRGVDKDLARITTEAQDLTLEDVHNKFSAMDQYRVQSIRYPHSSSISKLIKKYPLEGLK